MSHHEAATTVRELPERLPAGERILWQGAPNWRSLYRGAFHGRTLSLYFAGLLALRGVFSLADGHDLGTAALSMLWLTPLALAGLGIVAVIAWLTARATWYTITDRRVVMRLGIALEITFNFPYRVIESAGLRLHADGTGDLPITLGPGDRIAYLHLWPHARPWHYRNPQPMLRSVPQAELVADLLARALASATGGTASNVIPMPARPRSVPSGVAAPVMSRSAS